MAVVGRCILEISQAVNAAITISSMLTQGGGSRRYSPDRRVEMAFATTSTPGVSCVAEKGVG